MNNFVLLKDGIDMDPACHTSPFGRDGRRAMRDLTEADDEVEVLFVDYSELVWDRNNVSRKPVPQVRISIPSGAYRSFDIMTEIIRVGEQNNAKVEL
jgi:hypothetical protein